MSQVDTFPGNPHSYSRVLAWLPKLQSHLRPKKLRTVQFTNAKSFIPWLLTSGDVWADTNEVGDVFLGPSSPLSSRRAFSSSATILSVSEIVCDAS